MPHIPIPQRDCGAQFTRVPETVGELTYALTSVLQAYIAEHQPFNYTDGVAPCTAALIQCFMDFEREVVAPYEHDAADRNGNAWFLLRLAGLVP